MKKALKFIAQFFLVWVLVGLFSFLSYRLLAQPVIMSYEKYGWEGAAVAIVALTVFYSLLVLLVHGIGKLIDFATE